MKPSPAEEYRKLKQLKSKNSDVKITIEDFEVLASCEVVKHPIIELFQQIYKVSPDLPFTDFFFSYEKNRLGYKDTYLHIFCASDSPVLSLKDFYEFSLFMIREVECFVLESNEDKMIKIGWISDNDSGLDTIFYFLSLNPMIKTELKPSPWKGRIWRRIEIPLDSDVLEFFFWFVRKKVLLRCF